MSAGPELEPSGEPAPASGVALLLRTAAEACLPALRAQIEAQDLLPQQALGALSFCCEVLSRVLVNLEDPAALAKFGKLKVAALRKRLTRRPELAEKVLQAAGFREAGDHLEWGPESPEALAAALVVLALASRLQATAQTAAGLRHLSQALDSNVTCAEVASLSYGCCLLEQVQAGGAKAAGSVEGALVQRSWLASHLPGLASALEAYPSLLSTRTREKALLRATLRALNEQRAKLELPKVAFVQILAEAAQLAAAAELAALRTGALVEAAPAAVASAEPDLEPEAEAEVEAEPEAAPASPAAVPVSEGRRAAEVLLRCVPAFRLEPSCGTFSRVLRLAEAPAFFTMAPKEKAYEVSLQSLAETTAAEWSGQEDWPAARVVGLGCSVDMDRDDKALLFAVFA